MDHVDRCVWKTCVVGGPYLQFGLQLCVIQSLTREPDQVRRDVNADGARSALDQGNKVAARPTTQVKHSLAVHVSQKMKRVFQRERSGGRRRQITRDLRRVDWFEYRVLRLDGATLDLSLITQ